MEKICYVDRNEKLYTTTSEVYSDLFSFLLQRVDINNGTTRGPKRNALQSHHCGLRKMYLEI